MKASTGSGRLFLLSFLAALALTLLGAGLSWAGPGGSVGYWGGVGGSDVGSGVTGDLLKGFSTADYDIAVDDSGDPHVVWAAPTATIATPTPTSIICYSFYDGSRWRGLPDAGDHTEFGMGNNCKLAIVPGGWPVVTYVALDQASDKPVIQALIWTGAMWETILSPELSRIEASCFKVVVDAQSRLHFVYRAYVKQPDGSTHRYLGYCFFDGQTLQGLGGSNEGQGLAGDVPDLGFSYQFDLALDSKSFPHIVWDNGEQLFYKFWDGAAWQPVQGQDIFPFAYAVQPRIALDAQDRPHITVFGANPSGILDIYYAAWDGSAWQNYPQDNGGYGIVGGRDLLGSPGPPDMALDAAGNLNLCWGDAEANSIHFRRWDGTGFGTLDWGDVGWGVAPPPPFIGAAAGQWYGTPKMALGGPADQLFFIYSATTNIAQPDVPPVNHFNCRVSTFLQDAAPYPLLALETDNYSYERGATTVTVMLGADNQRDEWVDTELFLGAYDVGASKLYEFLMSAPLPPHFYFPLSAAFQLPIGQGQLFHPSLDCYFLGGQFLDAATGAALGPLEWEQIFINK